MFRSLYAAWSWRQFQTSSSAASVRKRRKHAYSHFHSATYCSAYSTTWSGSHTHRRSMTWTLASLLSSVSRLASTSHTFSRMFRRHRSHHTISPSQEHAGIGDSLFLTRVNRGVLLQQCDPGFHHGFSCLLPLDLDLLLNSWPDPTSDQRTRPKVY